MKKLGLITTTVVIIMSMTAIFYACQKDDVLNNANQEQVENPSLKYLNADWFISAYDGRMYKLDTHEAWALFSEHGGKFWYYDSNGVKHWCWPQTGKDFYRPPHWWSPDNTGSTGNGNNNSSPLPYPSIGEFVQYTLIDIMNAPIDQRRDIVIKNMQEPYHPGFSLREKIEEDLLEKVVSGEYIISRINEKIDENADQTRVACTYIITFSNKTDKVEERTVLFNYGQGTIEPTDFNIK